jgi:hypothetical protein
LKGERAINALIELNGDIVVDALVLNIIYIIYDISFIKITIYITPKFCHCDKICSLYTSIKEIMGINFGITEIAIFNQRNTLNDIKKIQNKDSTNSDALPFK